MYSNVARRIFILQYCLRTYILDNAGFHKLYSSLKIIGMIILRSMCCTGYVARNVQITTAYDTSIRNLNRRLSATTKHSKTSNLKVEVIRLNPELNPICYLLALLGDHHFLHVSRIRVKSLTLRRLM